MIRRAASVLGLALLAACAGQSSTPTASPAASPAALEPVISPGSSPSVEASGSARVRLIGDGPVLDGPHGPPGHPYDLPGAVVRDEDGLYHLFVTWFGPEPGDQVVTVSTSRDAIYWDVEMEPLYDDLGFGFDPPGPVPSEALQMDGTWVLYGWGAELGNRRVNTTWRATAPDPGGPWTADPGPILELGPARTWDDAGAAAMSVRRHGDGYWMWYEGFSTADDRGAIGFADAVDGVHWTKHPEPVLAPGDCGTSTAGGVFLPSVVEAGDGYLMLFGGLERAGGDPVAFVATSTDGRHWTCLGNGPIAGLERFSGADRVHTFEAFVLAERPAVLLEVLQQGHSALWLGEIEID